MHHYKIKIEERALHDIQEGFEYYEDKQAGFGVRFNQSVFDSFEILRQNPFYQIRYNTFRCLPVKKFPFMVHYEVDEAEFEVIVYAVINTYKDPDKNWFRGRE